MRILNAQWDEEFPDFADKVTKGLPADLTINFYVIDYQLRFLGRMRFQAMQRGELVWHLDHQQWDMIGQ